LKKLLLMLTLATTVVTPLTGLPEVQAAEQGKPQSQKSKTANQAAAKKKVANQSGTKFKKQANAQKTRKRVVERYNPNTPLRLAQSSDGALHANDLDLKSAAALVVDQKSGEALYAKNTEIPSSIASITKLMTAMVTLDADLPLDEEISISAEDMDRLKGTGSRLAIGTRLTRQELLNLALIASENRAAAALSRAYPGGRDAFVTAMNRKAREIGMGHTHFVDSTGLNSQNKATAADLVKMVDAAYRYPLIREISSSGSFDIAMPGSKVVRVKENGKIRRVARSVVRQVAFHNTNSLTRSKDWNIGVSKTGYINEAGRCLVMQAKIAERKVIIVLLDSWGKYSRIGDAQRIKHWLEKDQQLASRSPRKSA
jgi:D-alanyl-D-alanine endopeptidase (penicillin-binding protein 7)